MKKKNYFLSVIFSLFALSGILTSCENINWFANFMDDMNVLSVPFTFNSLEDGTGENLINDYVLGKTYTDEQLINDSKTFILEHGPGNSPYHNAIVYALKLDPSSSVSGVIRDTDEFITCVNATEPLSFVPVIYYTAEFTHWMEDLNGEYDPRSTSSAYGPNGYLVDIDGQAEKYNKSGFTYDHSAPTSPTFSSSGKQFIDLYYKRKSVTITFNYNGGFLSGQPSSTVTRKFETPTSLLIPNNPTKTNYVFNGWNPLIPDTFPAVETTYTAQWVPEEYTVEYSDCDLTTSISDSAASGKPASYSTTGLLSKYSYGNDTYIDGLTNMTVSGYLVRFGGWYTHPSGDETSKLDYDFSSNKYKLTDGTTKLYAKWLPQYVYCDPQSSAASDQNSGFSQSAPVKTIAAAKALMKDNNHGYQIRFLSKLTEKDDIQSLSGTYKNDCGYGADGKGITVVSKECTLIEYNGTDEVELNDVYIGGGASSWDHNTYNIGNNFLIRISNSGKLKLGENCTINNIGCTNSRFIYNQGTLIIDGAEISNIVMSTTNSIIENSSNMTFASGTLSCGNIYGIKSTGSGIVTLKNSPVISDKIRLEGNSKISVDSSFTLGSAEKIKVEVQPPVAGLIVLTDEVAKYESFECINEGYVIGSDGKLAKATGTTITINDPENPIGYNLGTIAQTSAKLTEGSATVRINIPAETYEKIDDWGGGSSVEKYVMYTCSLQTGTFKSRINSAGDGTYYADIKIGNATTTNGSTSSAITSPGLVNIFVFANPEADDGSVVITGTEAVIMVY